MKALVPVIHKCRLPGSWIRFRRRYRSGTRINCPDCGIRYYWSGWRWVPQDTINSAKVAAMSGHPIMNMVSAYPLSPDERREVIDFQRRWLHWEER